MSEVTAMTKWQGGDTPKDEPRLPMWRKGLIFAGVIATAGALPMWLSDKPMMPLVIIGFSLAVFLTGGMALSKKLSLQLLARSIWWQVALYSSVLIGVAIYHDNGRALADFWPVWAMLGGAAVSIAAAGKMGLTRDNALFAPKGFRAALMLSLILALADTQALLFYGAMFLEEGIRYSRASALTDALPFLACAGVMGLALHGLYRLKIWGLGLNIVANVLIAGLALGGVLDLPDVLANLLAATAVAQLFIPAPLLFAMVKRAGAALKKP